MPSMNLVKSVKLPKIDSFHCTYHVCKNFTSCKILASPIYNNVTNYTVLISLLLCVFAKILTVFFVFLMLDSVLIFCAQCLIECDLQC